MLFCFKSGPNPPSFEVGLYFLFVYVTAGFAFGVVAGVGAFIGGAARSRALVFGLPLLLLAGALAYFSWCLPALPERLSDVEVGFRSTPIRLAGGVICAIVLTPTIHAARDLLRRIH